MIGLLTLIADAVAGPIPALVGQLPALMESLSTTARRLEDLLDRLPGADRFAGLDVSIGSTLLGPRRSVEYDLSTPTRNASPHPQLEEYRDAPRS